MNYVLSRIDHTEGLASVGNASKTIIFHLQNESFLSFKRSIIWFNFQVFEQFLNMNQLNTLTLFEVD